MRHIVIEMRDTEKDMRMRAETTLEQINDLFESHGIIGVIDILHQLNFEMNKELNENVKLSFSTQIGDNKKGTNY